MIEGLVSPHISTAYLVRTRKQNAWAHHLLTVAGGQRHGGGERTREKERERFVILPVKSGTTIACDSPESFILLHWQQPSFPKPFVCLKS